MTFRTGWIVHSFQQVMTRIVAKSQFLLGLASMMTQALNNDDQPHVQERLGN